MTGRCSTRSWRRRQVPAQADRRDGPGRRGAPRGGGRLAAGPEAGGHRILELIGQGLTNRQIGQRLLLAEKTVKNYVSSILAKLGIEQRVQAAILVSELKGHAPRRPLPAGR
jgi:DNA-binding CsgD family transcriptional regulator